MRLPCGNLPGHLRWRADGGYIFSGDIAEPPATGRRLGCVPFWSQSWMTHDEIIGPADIGLVAIRCADARGIPNEENDNGSGPCPDTAVSGRDGPGARRRCCARRGFGRRLAWSGRRGGRCFRRLCGRTVDCQRLGSAAIKPLQTRAQARSGRAGRECRRKRARSASAHRNGCAACSSAGCSIAATCAKECTSHAAGAAAGMRAFGKKVFAELISRPARI